ncbi:hypothetical protein ABZ702_02660 [Streptomyces cyaneofuscatus]|uniref:hypothetical protein n=1 Tax=Streptomyces cyaneofuscatus TaxID=66883 RepID=UPI0033EE6C26
MPHRVVDEGRDLSPGFHLLVRIAAVSVRVLADECQSLTETAHGGWKRLTAMADERAREAALKLGMRV